MNIVLGNWKDMSINDLRLRPRYTQNKGFFCSLTWLLECLPYIDNYLENNADDSKKKLIGFEFYSHNYGSYPNFSVFGKNLITYFPSLDNPIEKTGPKDLVHHTSLTSNFKYAHELFFKYFNFSSEIYEESSDITKSFKNKKILGLHFRGTDKLTVKWADHTSIDDFMIIIDDYLSQHPVDGIFFCTDSLQFKNKMIHVYSSKYTLYYNKNQDITESPLHLTRLNVLENITNAIKNGHPIEKKLEIECSKNDYELKQVILDSIVLSKCSTVIKTHSLVSCFSKIINPELEIYRLNGCSELYYPESYIPFYHSNNVVINNILQKMKTLPY